MSVPQKAVLIITYYWPPSGGAGVQRWLKFTKYLRDFGWEPIIFTPENPERPSVDESLMDDVPPGIEILTNRITEPYDYYRKLVGAGKGEKISTGFLNEQERPKRKEALARFIRGNFFIPDARRWWIRPSVKFLTAWLADNPGRVQAMVSTGPPHSTHLIAQGVAQKNGIPWLADFRDPWTQIDFLEELRLTRWAAQKHMRLERQVFERADMVLGAWPGMPEMFPDSIRRMEVITNGYDAADLPDGNVALDDAFTIAHVGSFSPARNPQVLWRVLRELSVEAPGFSEALRIKLAGKIDHTVRNDIAAAGLEGALQTHDYIPHSAIPAFQASSQLLLLVVNRTKTSDRIIPGKLFEYLAARRPIIAITPAQSDIARLVRETESGVVVDYEDDSTLRKFLLKAFRDFQSGTLRADSRGVEAYDRRSLTGALAQLLDELSSA